MDGKFKPNTHPQTATGERLPMIGLGHEALKADPHGREALETVRSLIDRVVLTPATDSRGYEIELIGEIAAMIGKRPAETVTRF